MCAVVREITEAGSLASLNSGGGGDAGLSGGHLVICESAEVIKLLFRFVTEGATWGGDKEQGVKQEVTKEACKQHEAENTSGLCVIRVRCYKIEGLSKI